MRHHLKVLILLGGLLGPVCLPASAESLRLDGIHAAHDSRWPHDWRPVNDRRDGRSRNDRLGGHSHGRRGRERGGGFDGWNDRRHDSRGQGWGGSRGWGRPRGWSGNDGGWSRPGGPGFRHFDRGGFFFRPRPDGQI
ncbi:hypothetical protein SAMN07250955_102258 [Arboricoccus pini]|uniref:Uncharacterized protein n=1 Tax=Arboricoccus pini TaxID=1963835 RepID=A0A212QQC1_9PROT|nr:hypothetical protein [Arboricoccus pini]SNB61471.1 hypothetical protein SAMN07250955_102258 [Arboricoccus pini]